MNIKDNLKEIYEVALLCIIFDIIIGVVCVLGDLITHNTLSLAKEFIAIIPIVIIGHIVGLLLIFIYNRGV